MPLGPKVTPCAIGLVMAELTFDTKGRTSTKIIRPRTSSRSADML
jgi:hypothetical protein